VDHAGLLAALREEAGLDLAALIPAGGESGSAFWATDAAGTAALLKIAPGPAAAALAWLRALEPVITRLRERGYPAPRWRAVGEAGGSAFWIQETGTGAPLESGGARPDFGLASRLLPELIRLNDAQAGLGGPGPGLPGQGSPRPGDPGGQIGWPALITTTLTEGGPGYCVHATLAARPATRDLLRVLRRIGETCGPGLPEGRDFVHYDFSLANVLSDGTAVTAVVDVNPPVLAGDRAFDLATLLYYLYDDPGLRARLWARLLEVADRGAARAYLAHLVLRQVDWSLRFYPRAAGTRRHLRLARLAVADISDGAS
jgi:hypothetical protein